MMRIGHIGKIFFSAVLCFSLMACGAVVRAEDDLLHFLLNDKHTGVCEELVGDVEVAIVMVETPDAPWNEASQQELERCVDAAIEWLECEAEAYDAALNMSARYYTVSAENAIDIDQESVPWAEAILDREPSLPSLWRDWDGDWNPMPVIFCLNTPGRAFACNYNSGEILEYIVIYSPLEYLTICHELMHLYGAADLYYHEELERLARQQLGNSIMLPGGAEREVDSLTAYVIGWTDELDEQAMTLLAGTADLTEDELYNAMVSNVRDGFYTEEKPGLIYTGMFQGGAYHGWGTVRWEDGNSYEGQWVWGARTGIGTMKWASGDIYTGSFKDGAYDGVGKLQFAVGGEYTGEFVNGQYHGMGTLIYTDGSMYTGKFVNGQYYGMGTQISTDGSMYTGEFVNGQRHGMGTLIHTDGSMYTGEFVNGQYYGMGTQISTDGSMYIGEYVKGSIEGEGTYFFANGDLYTGNWVNNQRNGQGTYVWPETGYYSGDSQNGQWNGYGVYNGDDGTLMQGNWEDGVFIGE